MKIDSINNFVYFRIYENIYLFFHPRFVNKIEKIKEFIKKSDNKNLFNLLSFIIKIIKNIMVIKDKEELEEIIEEYEKIQKLSFIKEITFDYDTLNIKIDGKKEINNKTLKLLYKYFILKEGLCLVIYESNIKDNILRLITAINIYFNAFKIIKNNFEIITNTVDDKTNYIVRCE